VKRVDPAVTLALLVQAACAVGTYLVGKEVTSRLDPFSVICTRLLLSALVLGALLVALKPRPPAVSRLPPRAMLPRLIVAGFFAGPVNQGAFLYGLSKTHPAHAALLYALTPAGVYLASIMLGRERPTGRRMLGIAVAFGGVAVLLLGKGLAEARGTLEGDAWVLAAVASWVVVTLLSKELIPTLGALQTTAWMLVLAGGWALLGTPWLLDFHALAAADAVTLSGIAYLVLVASTLAYLLYNFALSRADASFVAVFANLQPVGTALAAWWWRGEPITRAMLIGGALVLGGVRLASWMNGSRERGAEAAALPSAQPD
jgi:drug/metabolite transporter (DMT)-like permease